MAILLHKYLSRAVVLKLWSETSGIAISQNSLEMQNLRSDPGISESKTLELGPSNLCSHKPFRELWYTLKTENHLTGDTECCNCWNTVHLFFECQKSSLPEGSRVKVKCQKCLDVNLTFYKKFSRVRTPLHLSRKMKTRFRTQIYYLTNGEK